jgi:hypothetical protein
VGLEGLGMSQLRIVRFETGNLQATLIANSVVVNVWSVSSFFVHPGIPQSRVEIHTTDDRRVYLSADVVEVPA